LINQGDRVFLRNKDYHQRGADIMTQGVLPFKYEEEKKDSSMTALAGLPIYMDLASAMGCVRALRGIYT
jgi:hypothetical protein